MIPKKVKRKGNFIFQNNSDHAWIQKKKMGEVLDFSCQSLDNNFENLWGDLKMTMSKKYPQNRTDFEHFWKMEVGKYYQVKV